MKVNTSELQDAALDWAVAKCEEWEVEFRGEPFEEGLFFPSSYFQDGKPCTPSTDWAQGGPIIEREKMQLWIGLQWNASMESNSINPAEFESGPTPLIAAMRCYVASKLGDVVEVPEEVMA